MEAKSDEALFKIQGMDMPFMLDLIGAGGS
jgi:hypothetical protein